VSKELTKPDLNFPRSWHKNFTLPLESVAINTDYIIIMITEL